MKTKLWIAWGVMACITFIAATIGAEKWLVYVFAFMSAGFGWAGFFIT